MEAVEFADGGGGGRSLQSTVQCILAPHVLFSKTIHLEPYWKLCKIAILISFAMHNGLNNIYIVTGLRESVFFTSFSRLLVPNLGGRR